MREIKTVCDMCKVGIGIEEHLWTRQQVDASGSESERTGGAIVDLCHSCLSRVFRRVWHALPADSKATFASMIEKRQLWEFGR